MTEIERIKRASEIANEIIELAKRHMNAVQEVTKKHGPFASIFYKFLAIGYAIQLEILRKKQKELNDEFQTSSANNESRPL